MGRKILVLLGSVGLLSPVILQSLATSVILITLASVLVVFLALFNQKVLNRLIKLITATTSIWRQVTSTKKN